METSPDYEIGNISIFFYGVVFIPFESTIKEIITKFSQAYHLLSPEVSVLIINHNLRFLNAKI